MAISDSDEPGGRASAVPEEGGRTAADSTSAAQASDLPTPGQHHSGSLWKLTLGSVGVVYGDIGTSPIYAMRESLRATAEATGGPLQRGEVIGVISLLIWSLIVVVTFKYFTFVLRADNRGEGGTLSLVALVQQALGRRPAWLLGLGMVGLALFLGDAMITPAISVLSAVEGVSLVTLAFDRFTIPVTLVIVAGLFLLQRWGTAAVSRLFGPVMVTWFLTLGVLGAYHVGDDLAILSAFNPTYAAGFIAVHGFTALIVLGSIFLAVTGAESLYADLGHFGRRPLRLAWFLLVFPALTLNYLGQGALVLAHPEAASNPLFLLAPPALLLPLVILATMAAVIASQAVISGTFSAMKQAVRMGLLPRLEILHTSEAQEGQIYLPKVNMILAVGVVILVLVFGSSSDLASVYGVAVSGVMLITTTLTTLVFLLAWRWRPTLVAVIVLPFAAFELSFFVANLFKIPEGGWVPILFAAAGVTLMWTWVRGTRHVQQAARRGATPVEALIEMLDKSSRLKDVPGTAIFLTSDPDIAPAALMHNIKHNHVLHERNMIVCVNMATRPFVPDGERLQITRLSERFTRIDMTFGYMEETNVPRALALARKQGEKFDIMSTSFFLNRRTFRPSKTQGLPSWQESLYMSLTKSAANATDFYRLPTNRVIELGQQIII